MARTKKMPARRQDIEPSTTIVSMPDRSGSRAGSTTISSTFEVEMQDPHVANPDSLETLGKSVSELINSINQLEQFGIESKSLPLPKIVVVGDQSSGKSSLIEAISEIKVPRASGLCTRCPLRINIKPTASDQQPWSCIVSINTRYNWYNGQFGQDPWVEKDIPTEVEFARTTSKAELEILIKRAQIAVLNPGSAPSNFLDEDFPEENAVTFSPNIVNLDISGPHLPTLSLYDLPGIISQSESGEKHLIQLVKKLAREYISNENTIVLLAYPMTVDPATSNAGGLVRDAQAQERCLGVLTKPDRLAIGESLQDWAGMLKNTKFTLGYGYSVALQPSQAQLDAGITNAEARILEHTFFNKDNAPWSTDFAEFSPRFGTPNLQKLLSELLAKVISKALPSIANTIRSKLETIDNELQQFPEPPRDNAMATVFTLVERFRTEVDKHMTGEIDRHINGEISSNSFILGWRQMTIDFRNELMAQKPGVLITTGAEPEWKKPSTSFGSFTNPLALNSDDEDEPPSLQDNGKRRMPSSTPSTPVSKRARGEPQTPRNRKLKHEPIYTEKKADLPEYKKSWGLQAIAEITRNHSTSGIPNGSDSRAEDYFISHAVEKWSIALNTFQQLVYQSLRETLETILKQVLREWYKTALWAETYASIQEQLDSITQSNLDNAAAFLRAEQLKPTTFNEEYLEYQRKKEMDAISERRRYTRAKSYLVFTEARPLEGPIYEKKLASLTNKELGDDKYIRHIEMMSRVRGYYNVAAATLVDSIAKMMQMELFEKARMTLASGLVETLRITEAEGMFSKLLIQEAHDTTCTDQYRG